MGNLKLRETSFRKCLVCSITYGGWFAFSVFVPCIFFVRPEFSPYLWVPFLLLLLYSPFIFMGIIGLIKIIISYNTWLIISEDEVILKRGKRVQHMSISEITEYGCAGFIHRSSYLFFCDEQQSNIIEFFERNRNLADRYFGKERAKKMCKTQQGLWQLQVGVYVHAASKRKTGDHVLFFRNDHPEHLNEVNKLIEKMPMRTGPKMIDDSKL